MENTNISYKEFQSAWKTMNLYAYYKRAEKQFLAQLKQDHPVAVRFKYLGEMQTAASRLIKKQPLYYALLCEDLKKYCPEIFAGMVRNAKANLTLPENGLLDAETKKKAIDDLNKVNVDAINTVHKYQPDKSHVGDKEFAMGIMQEYFPSYYEMLTGKKPDSASFKKKLGHK